MSRETDPHSQAPPPAVRAKKSGRVPLISGGQFLEGATLERTSPPKSRQAHAAEAQQTRRRKARVPATPTRPAYPPDWPAEEDWRATPAGGIVHTCYGHGRVQRVNQRGSEHERLRCAYCRQPWKLEGGRWVRVQV